MKNKLLGGIEAGGTKFRCGVGTEDSAEVLCQTTIPTGEPEITMRLVSEFFRSLDRPVDAIGIGAFGPVQLDPASPQFGYITSTPKRGWQHFDIRGTIKSALDVPVAFDTDVNAAALGEALWGAARGANTSLYVTVGTGIGGGMLIGEIPLYGLSHPEMGHIRIPHDLKRDPPERAPITVIASKGLPRATRQRAGPSLRPPYPRRSPGMGASSPNTF